MPSAREVARVKWFNPTSGYGFLVAADGREFFAHMCDVTCGAVPRQNDEVEFSRGVGRDGRPKARQIVVLKPGN